MAGHHDNRPLAAAIAPPLPRSTALQAAVPLPGLHTRRRLLPDDACRVPHAHAAIRQAARNQAVLRAGTTQRGAAAAAVRDGTAGRRLQRQQVHNCVLHAAGLSQHPIRAGAAAVSSGSGGARGLAAAAAARCRRRQAHRVVLAAGRGWAPAQAREAFGGLDGAPRELEIVVGAGKVQAEDLRAGGGGAIACGALPAPDPGASRPPGGRIGRAAPPNCCCRRRPTSSVLLLSKDSEMAPLTLPAARKGPLGQNDSVAERSAVLSMAAKARSPPGAHRAVP